MLKLTPAMGWNSWNTFGDKIDEELILKTADVLADKFLKFGYEYLVIDDCWSLKERDENDRLVPDPEKFPHGMKYVSDYVHSKGLKFGMYSCAGNLTCAGYPGSYEYEFIDAETFAEWGVDFLKYDYCYHTEILHGKYLYRRMGLALDNCGRDILFSACSWGADNTAEWVRETSSNMWRSTGDISDGWESIKNLALEQLKILPYGGIGCFNDMDMLVVGMYGKGNVGLKGCNDVQYRSHFSLWALLSSPLMIGCDIRSISDEAMNILSNKDIIEINQDPASKQIIKLAGVHNNDNILIFEKQLSNGDIAIGCFNLSDADNLARFNLDEIGLPISTGKTLKGKDLWSKEEILIKNSSYYQKLAPFECRIYRFSIVNAK